MNEIRADRSIYDFIIMCFKEDLVDLGINECDFPSYTAFMSYEKFLKQGRQCRLFFTSQGGLVALRDKDQAYEIKWLCVHPSQRHRGLGRTVMDFCVSEAKAQGKKQLVLGCYKENDQLVSWYLDQGFKQYKINKRRTGPIWFMKKAL